MNEQQRKALELALEAMETMQNAIYNIGGEHVQDLGYAIEKADVAEQAITAIKEALAQPQQEKERCVGCEACINTACGRDECPKGWPKAPHHKPLTDEEIMAYRQVIDWTAEWSYIKFARSIEAAHGIKE